MLCCYETTLLVEGEGGEDSTSIGHNLGMTPASNLFKPDDAVDIELLYPRHNTLEIVTEKQAHLAYRSQTAQATISTRASGNSCSEEPRRTSCGLRPPLPICPRLLSLENGRVRTDARCGRFVR